MDHHPEPLATRCYSYEAVLDNARRANIDIRLWIVSTVAQHLERTREIDQPACSVRWQFLLHMLPEEIKENLVLVKIL